MLIAVAALIACEPLDNPDKDSDKEQTENNNSGNNGNQEGSGNGGNTEGGDNTGDNGNTEGGDNPGDGSGDNGNTDGGNTDITGDPEQAKNRLESTAVNLMETFPADEYEHMLELYQSLAEYGDEIFDEDYDLDELENVFEEKIDKTIKWEELSEYEYNCTLLILLSNWNGEIEFTDHKAYYNKSDKTRVTFRDGDNNVWTADLTFKDVTKEYLGEFVDYYTEGYDAYDITVEIPATAELSVKKNGKFFADVTVKLEYGISEGGADLEKDHAGISTEIKIDDLSLSAKASYDASSGEASFSETLKKDGEAILTSSISGKVTYRIDEDYEFYDVDPSSLKLNIDLMGELQIKGTCSDVDQLIGYADQDLESETDAERTAERMNELINIGLYYDGGNTKQGGVELEPFVDESGQEYYYAVVPVVVFGDDTRYYLHEYFTEDAFGSLIERAENLLEDYEDLLNRYL